MRTTGPATAGDARQAIEITADTLEVRQSENVAIFEGDVKAEQGEMVLNANMLTVYYRDVAGGQGNLGVARIDAQGNVVVSSPDETAQGQSGVYDVENGRIDLAGGVVLNRGNNIVRGEMLTMDLESGSQPGLGRQLARARPVRARGPRRVTRAGRRGDRRMTRPATAGTAGGSATPVVLAGNPGLRAENLGKSFKKRPVLRGLSLTVQRGEAVGLLGPNGAGKTTCFYLMTGLMAADYGRVFLDGHDITGASHVPPRPPRSGLPAAGGLDFSRAHGGEQHPRRAGGLRACAGRARTRARRAAGGVLDHPSAAHALTRALGR